MTDGLQGDEHLYFQFTNTVTTMKMEA